MSSVSIQSSEAGVQPEADGRLLCLECGRWYRALGSHLVQGEGTTPEAYRERHGLPATLPLAAADLRSRWREQTRRRRESGDLPTAVDPAVSATGRRNGAARHALTAARPGVRTVHQAGIVKARALAVAKARASLDETAVRLGHADWHRLIADTCHLDAGMVARLTGRERQTITYWRRKLVGPDWKTASGYLHPNRAAAYARIDREFAARGWTSLADALAGTGIRALARTLATTTPSLRAWEHHRRARSGLDQVDGAE
ncbi:MucR family transcriptional regulator [Actinoallomurus acaciae]|uniref:MucR family transcriptional regulator n=1 Tax=Actinoallomurus acaciae TaxID=502577 RepID=A0ABV5YX62_9ACTN